ncbi:MAG: putative ABC transport system permease protein, partial [Paraglaciecola sp.]
MTDHSPPIVLAVFLRWFCHPDYLEDIEGDMEEKFFHIAENKGRSSARRWYFLHILKLIRPNLIRPFFNTQRFNHFGMLNNYLTISLRNIKRKAGFSFLNIAGLGIGMACCILIFLYVSHENSYDSYHSKHGRIYRVLQTFRSTNEGVELEDPTPEEFSVWGNARVGPALLNDYPEVEKFTRFTGPQSQLVSKGEKRFQEKTIWFADSSTFEIFDWELIRGDRKTALSTPGAIVLTETFAKKYFDDLDPMGQTLLLDNENTVTVTGLMKDVPSNSHLQFDALISQVTNHSWWSEQFEWWGYVDFYTYVLLKENANQPENITDNLNPFYTNYVPTWEGYKVDLEPLSLRYAQHSETSRLSLRLSGQDLSTTVAELSDLWNQLAP